MQEIKTCKTCAYWVEQWPVNTRPIGRLCKCPKLANDYGQVEPDGLIYLFAEQGDFWTGPDFGCVHHSEVT